jgi:hypothetical protein
MTAAATFQVSKANNVNEQRVARFAAMITGLFTILWALLLSDFMGEYVLALGLWQIATHGLSLLSALIVYLYCRHLNYRTSAAGLLCFVAVAFFFADVAMGFNYSPFFGVALIAWAASARRPFLAGAGVLAVGAAILARFHPSLDYLAVTGAGLIILAIAPAKRPKNPTDWH